jgi:hypothetical protein
MNMSKTAWSLALLPLMFISIAAADEQGMVPFVLPPGPALDSLEVFAPGAPIGVDSPRVVVANSHFAVAGKPIRFWGVNLTFGASFPEHADAEALALRLSEAGINCVRLHHMDMQNWEDQRGIWDRANPTKLSAAALDRLDYLLDQLARRGIYADLNLHVSRTHSKFLGLPPVPGVPFDKMTDLFMPEIIDAEKEYARQLLGHVSKYRGVRFADDPVFAILEISNEDSFFEWGALKHLEELPEPYAGKLQTLFCDWLQHRYGSTAALRKAWDRGAIPLGDELLRDNQFSDISVNWFLELHDGNSATMASSNHTVSVSVPRADGVSWHVQFEQQKLHLVSGQYYTLKFSARADTDRHFEFAVSEAHEPWENLGLDESVSLDKDWKDFSRGFVAKGTDDQARLAFQFAQVPGKVELKDVSLRPGGRQGLGAGESLEAKNISVFSEGQTPRKHLDLPIFLIETQKAFYDGMNRFIKNDLHCNIPATGTIVFSPLDLYCQSEMDFVDAHAYWQHPQFPGRQWDMHNWLIKNIAMVDHPQQATLFQLACSRLAGKPFTVTEYTHPAPNGYQAECVPEVSAFGAQQDWDAVFLFDYGAVPTKDHFENFFDLGSNPAKWAFMSSGAAIFRGRAIAPLQRSLTILLAGAGDPLDSLANYEMKYNLNMAAAASEAAKMDWPDFLNSRVYLTLKPGETKITGADSPHETGITWKVDADGHGIFSSTGPGAFAWVGHSGATPGSLVNLQSPAFAAITLVATDGRSLSTSKRLLITACGRCENTAMKFSPDRSTLTSNFGKAPVLVETVDATIRLPGALASGAWELQPLDASGRPKGPAHPLQLTADGSIHLDAADRTVWHLLTRG